MALSPNDPPTHELASIALGYARCLCGWSFRVDNYKGKTDESLAWETGSAYDEHRSKYEPSER